MVAKDERQTFKFQARAVRLRRPVLEFVLRRRLRAYPVTALIGPRQCGKTTLARIVAGSRAHYFDLERGDDFERLRNPARALEGLRGLVVLDEIQRRPELFTLLRVLADNRPLRRRFLVLGSAAPAMVRGVSESLAGRIAFVEMGGFTLDEAGPARLDRLWLRGGFPPSCLARSDAASFDWREQLVRTVLERDVPQLAERVSPATLRRFWIMLAHYHGQTWNASEIGASLGVSHPTARAYLDLLSGAFMVRQLQPWFLNIRKRTVKSPKVFVRDSGLFHFLQGVRTRGDLDAHPKLGASWEGFAMEQVLARTGDRDAYFWATHAGAELDLILGTGVRRWGFEFKYADVPRMTKSMAIAMGELELTHLWVVHPGRASYPLASRVTALAIRDLRRAVAAVAAGR